MDHTDYSAFGGTQNPNLAGSIQTNIDNRSRFEGEQVLPEQVSIWSEAAPIL